jgi:ketosteroid isomerase-like protein
MPRGNVELVREAVHALSRRDSDVLRELFDERAEFRAAIVGGGSLYRGHGDIDRYFADLDEAYEHWHTEDERLYDVGDDKVVFLYRIVGQQGGGAAIDQALGIIFTLRDRRIVLGRAHLDPLDAMKEGLQSAFRLFGRDDIDAAIANLDPDIVWEHQLGSGAPEEGVYYGRDELRRLLVRLRDSWENFEVQVLDVTEPAESRFVADAVVRASGKISDVELESGCRYALEFKDGKAVRGRFELTSPTPRSAAPPETTDVG